MPSPNLSELVTTTLRHRSGKLADNVSNNNALLRRLTAKGNNKLVSGGRTLVQELDYAENSTFMYYTGYDMLNIAVSDVLTAAEFDWKQAAVAVSMSGLEELQNSGKEAVIDWMEARIKNAERTMKNNISDGIYSNGTGSGGKQIGGLQLLVADDPTTGTVGGINRATASNAFWRNQVTDFTTDLSGASTSTNMQQGLNTLWLKCVRGTDRPDLIVADNEYYQEYLQSLQAIQRITSDDMGQAGFQSLMYMDAPFVLDGGRGGDCPTQHVYMLNTDFIFFKTHRNKNFVPLNPDRFAVNQDAMVKLVGWAGNMTLSCAFLQGVLKE